MILQTLNFESETKDHMTPLDSQEQDLKVCFIMSTWLDYILYVVIFGDYRFWVEALQQLKSDLQQMINYQLMQVL